MQKLLKLFTQITLLFLYVFHCNTLFTSEELLAERNRSARYFVQKFPSMTLPQAAQTFQRLEGLTKRMVWHKINQKSFEDNDDVLPTALGMLCLPPEAQYVILSENFDVLKNKQMSIPKEALEFLRTQSISEIFTHKARLNTKCKNNDCLDVKFHSKWIELPKRLLFGVSKQQIEVIKKGDNQLLSKKDLVIFDTLSKDLQNIIKPHFYCFYGKGKGMVFECRPTFTPKLLVNSFLHVCDKFQFPIQIYAIGCSCLLVTLLGTRYLIAPIWDGIRESRAHTFWEETTKKMQSNALIDEIQQKQLVQNSEILVKHTIDEVPSTVSNANVVTFLKPLAPLTPIPLIILLTRERMRKEFSKQSMYSKIGFVMGSFGIGLFGSAIILVPAYFGSKILFEDGILKGITTYAALCSAIMGIGLSGCTLGKLIGNLSIWKTQHINFDNNESVKQYLDDRTIDIKDF